MRTSGICPQGESVRSNGFTLLEALVVLAIIGLATALVAPASLRTIASWERATQAETLLGAMANLPDVSRKDGRIFRIDAGSHRALPDLPMPDGWTVELDVPLIVQANGACGGTRGRLVDASGVTLPFTLETPFCRIRLSER